jgi:hypothetical protein
MHELRDNCTKGVCCPIRIRALSVEKVEANIPFLRSIGLARYQVGQDRCAEHGLSVTGLCWNMLSDMCGLYAVQGPVRTVYSYSPGHGWPTSPPRLVDLII